MRTNILRVKDNITINGVMYTVLDVVAITNNSVVYKAITSDGMKKIIKEAYRVDEFIERDADTNLLKYSSECEFGNEKEIANIVGEEVTDVLTAEQYYKGYSILKLASKDSYFLTELVKEWHTLGNKPEEIISGYGDSGTVYSSLYITDSILTTLKRTHEYAVHGDLSLNNVLFTKNSVNNRFSGHCVIADFGSSVQIENLGKTPATSMTSGFFDPKIDEVGYYTIESDLYAVAAIMFFLITGYNGKTIDIFDVMGLEELNVPQMIIRKLIAIFNRFFLEDGDKSLRNEIYK